MEDLIKTNMLLESILTELKLLNFDVKSELIEQFKNKFLNTSNKEEIYNLIDGKTDSDDIASQLDCSPRTVRRFIKELEDLDLIDVYKDGKTKIPSKSEIKVLKYYISNNAPSIERGES